MNISKHLPILLWSVLTGWIILEGLVAYFSRTSSVSQMKSQSLHNFLPWIQHDGLTVGNLLIINSIVVWSIGHHAQAWDRRLIVGGMALFFIFFAIAEGKVAAGWINQSNFMDGHRTPAGWMNAIYTAFTATVIIATYLGPYVRWTELAAISSALAIYFPVSMQVRLKIVKPEWFNLRWSIEDTRLYLWALAIMAILTAARAVMDHRGA